MSSEAFMRRAIVLAEKGAGWTSPNPLVGAVIVKDGAVIGEGYHAKRGEAHAERNALAACSQSPEGATVYVTLEPCCHYGKTPPCTDALIAAGVSRVVIGSRDPNPKVAGQGAAILRQHGIRVEEDFLRDACDALNPIFFQYIKSGRPYVAMKYAMTADGKIATKTGASKWITGPAAREHVHWLRGHYRGILVGIGTVLKDDPMLDCRLPHGRSPLRVICDSGLRLPLESQIARSARQHQTIVACHNPQPEKREALETIGIIVWDLPLFEGALDLDILLQRLGAQEVDSVLVEGGSGIFGTILTRRLAHRLYCYVAPKLFGGALAPSPVGDPGVFLPEEAVRLTRPAVQAFDGGDLLLEYQFKEEG